MGKGKPVSDSSRELVIKKDPKIYQMEIILRGIIDIMFDRRFIISEGGEENIEPAQKFYFKEVIEKEEDKFVIGLPAENIREHLFSLTRDSVVKYIKKREYKDFCRIGRSSVFIRPLFIPFLDENDNEIKFTGFDNKKFYVVKKSGITAKGPHIIPLQVKERPVMTPPWRLRFNVEIIENTKINPDEIIYYFKTGGRHIGLGTFRPVYGLYEIESYKVQVKEA